MKNKIHYVQMALWKIKLEVENKFVERCVYVHVIRVRK